jgi:hypothetical protein
MFASNTSSESTFLTQQFNNLLSKLASIEANIPTDTASQAQHFENNSV